MSTQQHTHTRTHTLRSAEVSAASQLARMRELRPLHHQLLQAPRALACTWFSPHTAGWQDTKESVAREKRHDRSSLCSRRLQHVISLCGDNYAEQMWVYTIQLGHARPYRLCVLSGIQTVRASLSDPFRQISGNGGWDHSGPALCQHGHIQFRGVSLAWVFRGARLMLTGKSLTHPARAV